MKINFSSEQVELLRKMDIPFDPLSDLTNEEILMLDEIVCEYFSFNGIKENDEVDQIGLICENILDLIAES